MQGSSIRVLILSSDETPIPAGDLAESRFKVEHAEDLGAGLAMLSRGNTDVALLNLPMRGEDTLRVLASVRELAPEIPVVVIAGEGELSGLEAVRRGAHDHLVRGQFDGAALLRALQYAVERNRVQTTLRQLSLTDSLTGLYNRRGFVALSEHHVRLARRTRGLLLVRIVVDGLRDISSRFGDVQCDRALVASAEVLRSTFRASDVVARLSDEEFAVLAPDVSDSAPSLLTSRLEENLSAHNAASDTHYAISFRIDVTRLGPGQAASVLELLERAP